MRKDCNWYRIMFSPVLSFALVIVLSAALAVDINAEEFTMPSGDLAAFEPSDPVNVLSSGEVEDLDDQMASYVPLEEKLLINEAATFYYYENLDPVAKEIYDVMYGVAQDPVSEGNIGLMMTDLDPLGEEYYYEFNLASRALCFDHPELFWLYSGEKAELAYSSEAVSLNGIYFVYIKMAEPYTDFEEEMSAFNDAAAAFLADIDTGISEYETVLQIHDKLIDLVDYNDPVAEQAADAHGGQDLAHTAYGALVADSEGNVNYAVCDGYSLAFEYLLQQCGIDAVFIGGKAGSNEEEAGGHAWNMVKVDGEWYEVDCTWDDMGSLADNYAPESLDYKYIQEALNDEEYRDRIDHYLFLVSTEEISHFEPGLDYYYLTKDGEYVYQLAQESVHIRMEDNGASTKYDSAIIALAPVAMQSYARQNAQSFVEQ